MRESTLTVTGVLLAQMIFAFGDVERYVFHRMRNGIYLLEIHGQIAYRQQ